MRLIHPVPSSPESPEWHSDLSVVSKVTTNDASPVSLMGAQRLRHPGHDPTDVACPIRSRLGKTGFEAIIGCGPWHLASLELRSPQRLCVKHKLVLALSRFVYNLPPSEGSSSLTHSVGVTRTGKGENRRAKSRSPEGPTSGRPVDYWRSRRGESGTVVGDSNSSGWRRKLAGWVMGRLVLYRASGRRWWPVAKKPSTVTTIWEVLISAN